MHRTFSRSVIGALLTIASVAAPAASASAASPPSVFVRIEGASATLLPQTAVQSTDPTKLKGHRCAGPTVADALNVATNGSWSGSYSSSFHDFLIDTILGETPTGNDYWTLWVNGLSATKGACSTRLHPDDHVLWFDCVADANFNCTNNPLAIKAPAVVQQGRSATVTVTQLDGTGHSKPIAGAAVRGGGTASASNGHGKASLTFDHAGVVTLQATRSGATSSDPEFVCVYQRHPSECGNAGAAGPRVHVDGIRQHERFTQGAAPRQLHGTAGPDPTGLTNVSLGLGRRAPNGSCSFYDGTTGSWHHSACGAVAPAFSIGSSAAWSYLLPHRLAAGRYQLTVAATDGGGRTTKPVAGQSVIEFTVGR